MIALDPLRIGARYGYAVRCRRAPRAGAVAPHLARLFSATCGIAAARWTSAASLRVGARSGYAVRCHGALRASAAAPHLARLLRVACGIAVAHRIATASLRIGVRAGCAVRCRRAPRAGADAPHLARLFSATCGIAAARRTAVVSLRIGARPGLRTPCASAFAPHIARLATARVEHAWPAASALFAGGPSACRQAMRGRRGSEKPEAEGKIKDRGTACREKPACTWGRRGTRRWPAACREGAL